jgi:hypothetical protein
MEQVLTVVQSDEFQHAGIITFAIFTVLLSFLVYRWESRKLGQLSSGYFQRTFRGRKPWTCDGLKKRISDLESFQSNRAKTVLVHIALLILSVLILPPFAAILVVMEWHWISGNLPFVKVPLSLQNRNIDCAVALRYVAEQFSASATELLRMSGLRGGPYCSSQDSASYVFGVIYHWLIAGWAGLSTYALYVLWRANRDFKQVMDELHTRLHDQCLHEGKMART